MSRPHRRQCTIGACWGVWSCPVARRVLQHYVFVVVGWLPRVGVGCPETLSRRASACGGCSLSGGQVGAWTVRAARTSRPWGARAVTVELGWMVVEECCVMLLGKFAGDNLVWGLVSPTGGVGRPARHGLSARGSSPSLLVPAGSPCSRWSGLVGVLTCCAPGVMLALLCATLSK